MQVAQKPVIAVSGGSSGIGRATALLFAAQGCTVYVLSRHSANDASVHHIPCDVCDRAAVDAAFAQIFAAEGRLDTLINCAGMGISGAVEFTEAADAQRIFAVNLRAGSPTLFKAKPASGPNAAYCEYQLRRGADCYSFPGLLFGYQGRPEQPNPGPGQ